MDATHQNLISRAASLARQFHAMSEDISDIDMLFNGAPNYAAGITDQAIAEVPSFVQAGLTAQDVADVIFILKTANAIPAANNIAAWIKLANMS